MFIQALSRHESEKSDLRRSIREEFESRLKRTAEVEEELAEAKNDADAARKRADKLRQNAEEAEAAKLAEVAALKRRIGELETEAKTAK